MKFYHASEYGELRFATVSQLSALIKELQAIEARVMQPRDESKLADEVIRLLSIEPHFHHEIAEILGIHEGTPAYDQLSKRLLLLERHHKITYMVRDKEPRMRLYRIQDNQDKLYQIQDRWNILLRRIRRRRNILKPQTLKRKRTVLKP